MHAGHAARGHHLHHHLRHARALWLTAGVGRDELFGIIEAHCWRVLLMGAAVAVGIALLLLRVACHAPLPPVG